jgi:ubiquinone/menaquinone biosynthesis C-methylase UbiE
MSIISKLFDLSPIGMQIYSRKFVFGEKKIDYQTRFVNFDIKDGEKVLDIGSGGDPFPFATHLVDKYPGETHHRYQKLKTKNLPFTQADVQELPFKDKEFDFIYCSHVLEHVEDPAKAMDEISRVGKKGFIEVPARMSDIIFNMTRLKHFHKWYINKVGNKLIFIEYRQDELRDTGDKELFFMAHSFFTNAFKRMYRKNKDMFTHFHLWEDKIEYIVFNNEGQIIAKSE